MKFYGTPRTIFNPITLAPGNWRQINPITKAPGNWQQFNPTGQLAILKPRTNIRPENKGIDQLSEVDHVPTNTRSFQGKSQLYIFEDNKAVIKMIIKGRSPTMRPVSRTHRVALDWLFDRINLQPKIQIKYVDTKKQLADILVESHFCVCLNVMSFSTCSGGHLKSFLSIQRAP